jgi:hypothetical protein
MYSNRKMPDRKIRDAIFLSGIFLFGASYSDFQMYEDYQPPQRTAGHRAN